MPALGAPELIIILVIIILIFGVGKLPEVGQALGKGMREFRGAAEAGDETPESTPTTAPVVEAPRPVAAVEAPQTVVAPVSPTTTTAAAPVAAPSIGVSAPSVSAPSVSAPASVASSTATIAYTVQTGDTLDSIAQRHGVTTEALMVANGYSQRDRVLYEGDRLQLPTATMRA